jgi:tRNA threonylcarbamoyl adenosine modification protein YeaZ
LSGQTELQGWLLALDTATSTVVVAAGTADGRVLAADSFPGGHRHSQELLPAVSRLLERAGLRLADLVGIVVGTGPGAFTGMRVGLATAKTLAHELKQPVIGIPTSDALLAGAPEGAVVWLPSGPRDRLAIAAGDEPELIRAGDPGPGLGPGPTDLAVDLDGRAPEPALASGRDAVGRMAESLLRLGAARLAAGEFDDPERLVPRYATPPRGAPRIDDEAGVAWSRDPR